MPWEQTLEPAGNGSRIVYNLAGTQIRLTHDQFDADPACACAFTSSLDIFDAATAAIDTIKRDDTLNDKGIRQKIDIPITNAVSHLAGAWWACDTYEQRIASRESALYAVARLEPNHTAVAAEDAEIRAWFNSLNHSQRMSVLGHIVSKEALREPAQHERVLMALLRNPLARAQGLLENPDTNLSQLKLTNEVWRTVRREMQPAEAAAIDVARESAEWTRRGVQQLAGLFLGVHKVSRDDALLKVMTDQNENRAKGYGVFGVGPKQAEEFGLTKLRALGYEKAANGVWRKKA